MEVECLDVMTNLLIPDSLVSGSLAKHHQLQL